MKQTLDQHFIPQDLEVTFWGAVALALGGCGVVLASIFYALSPVVAALPTPNPSLAAALSGMVAGRATMLAAGTVGIFFDVIMASGTFLLTVFRRPASLQIERVGWALVTISILIFIIVDSLSAGVLTQIAVLDGALAAFAGFKLFYDVLFVLGAAALGLGGPMILLGEMKSTSPVLAKSLSWVGVLICAAGFISGLLYFMHVSLPQLIGISVAVGALIFAIYGVQIARSIRHTAF